MTVESEFFAYRFDPWAAKLLRVIGVRADLDGVLVDSNDVTASFGPLYARFQRDNISAVSVTGPYRAFKAIGPRLSVVDWGLTFGTTAKSGVCIEFIKPIAPVFGFRPHPGLTITVYDPTGLVAALEADS